jgi:cytochrome c oxidase cbb3-type subunit 2
MNQSKHRNRVGMIWPSALIGAALVQAACAPGSSDAPQAGPARAEVTMASAPAALSFGERRERRDRGRQLYLAECSGCHGERGHGDGPAAAVIDPKPRNFLSERFKFRSTAYNAPPLLGDVAETVRRGMPGSAMPAFDFLTDEERVLVSEYVLYLAGIEPARESDAVELPPESPVASASVEQGREVYRRLECFMCHGDEGRGDGPSSDTLVDELGRPIAARDFREGLFRRGESAAELYRTFLTGLPGTPMPSYEGNFTSEEGWDLARYVHSLSGTPTRPAMEPLALGRAVVEEKQCFACHVIEGRGGQVGPNLDVSSRKLRLDWAEQFLADPRAAGKIYPFTAYRMPDLHLEPDEIEGVLTLLAHVAGRTYPERPEEPPAIDAAKAGQGQLLYVLKCAECHNLGTAIPTPLAKQQGPDLIHISRRLRYEWIPEWVANPMDVYPGTAMVDTNLTREEIDVVRAFLWKASLEAIDG